MKIPRLLFTLIVAMLMAACASNETQETQSLANTYWRNIKSGDWLIGFTEGHVIYDSQWCEIVSTSVQSDKYNLPDEQQAAIERFLDVSSFPTYRLIDRGGSILDVNADPRDLDALERLLKIIE